MPKSVCPSVPLPNGERLISSSQLARMLGCTLNHLSRMRRYGDGPVYYRLGPKTIVYPQSGVDAWLETRRGVPTESAA